MRRLQTDVIDLYLIHWPDKHVPLDVTLRAIDVATKQGKIHYFIASNQAASQLCKMRWLADRRGWPPVVSSQNPLSLPRCELQHDLPFREPCGIGVTPYPSLQGGRLTGRYYQGQALLADS